MAEVLDIAVGVLVGADDRVLVAQRREDTPGAGFWEFPGGKQEPGETIEACLARELAEEIGVTDLTAHPLIRFAHARGPRPVRLHVYRIDAWTGEPAGREGQTVRWCPRAELSELSLLPASEVILAALALPAFYLVTPALARGRDARASWLAALDKAMRAQTHISSRPAPLLYLRQPDLDEDDYAALARRVLDQAESAGVQVLLDRSPALVERLGAHGLHWSARRAQRADARPVSSRHWFAVSCHDAAELSHAERIGADFATLSPVARTASHPDASPLGWPLFEDLRRDRALAIYALGGLGPADLAAAIDHHAQGIAAMRALWPGS